MSDDHASMIAKALVWANLRGVDSHGVVRLPRYLEMVEQGIMNVKAAPTISEPTAASVVIESDRAPGPVVAAGGRFAVVAGRFNELVVERLVKGCLDALSRHGVDTDARVDVIWVPGSFEIPLVCRKAAASGRYDAVIALGAVIRGATPHFDHVAGGAASGVMRASMDTGVPVIFGVLTTDTIEQAIERAGTKAGNKGFDAALAAVEMVTLGKALGDAGF